MTHEQAIIERDEWLEQFEGTHDVDAMQSDWENGNLETGASTDHTDEYVFETIIQTSIVNGQFKQARAQCTRFGVDPCQFDRLRE